MRFRMMKTTFALSGLLGLLLLTPTANVRAEGASWIPVLDEDGVLDDSLLSIDFSLILGHFDPPVHPVSSR
jgi:hypothetical protein